MMSPGTILIPWPLTSAVMPGDICMTHDMIMTRHYDPMSRSGVILGRHYTHAACSPSRAALLTGKYAWRLGLQRGNIGRYQPAGQEQIFLDCPQIFLRAGLGTEHKLLPEYLKSGGYVTHAIGKWHLGYCHDSYTPTRFTSHISRYGYLTLSIISTHPSGGALIRSLGCIQTLHTTDQGDLLIRQL